MILAILKALTALLSNNATQDNQMALILKSTQSLNAQYQQYGAFVTSTLPEATDTAALSVTSADATSSASSSDYVVPPEYEGD